ncbi:hypothetical protein SAMN05661003_10565 [Desulfuromonas thiophila]|uniref:Uncharacterized protein n=1 Tax=Desulfuromonas thiophila TaxID=57664 RepID=A0A1G7B532_9BACT|nr:hypothetical protein SAMN05661003_10565 [Desulfuromonas thiophila]
MEQKMDSYETISGNLLPHYSPEKTVIAVLLPRKPVRWLNYKALRNQGIIV